MRPRRRADSVWRARYGDGSSRSLVLFQEFQSTVDADMARRVLRNIGMASERLRRNRALDPDKRLTCAVHRDPLGAIPLDRARRRRARRSGRRRRSAGAGRPALSRPPPRGGVDARRVAREHLPECNLVSTLFELNLGAEEGDAAPPLRSLGTWLGELGTHAEPVRAAYAEWLVTTMPMHHSPEQAAALVERFAGGGTREAEEIEEAGMVVYTVAEDRLRRRISHAERKGERNGERRGERKGLAQGMEPLLANVHDNEGLAQVGEWIVDCADGEALIARFGNGGDDAS